jgi:hypothetical protein
MKKGKIFVKIDVGLKPEHPDLIKDINSNHYLVVSAENRCNFIRNGSFWSIPAKWQLVNVRWKSECIE